MPRTSAESRRVISPISFDRFRDEELETLKSKSKSSHKNMRRSFRAIEDLGVKTTGDLTPQLLDRYAAALKKAKLIDSAIADRLCVFRRMCNLAVERGALERSPFDARPELRLWMSRVLNPAILQRQTPSREQLRAVFLLHLKKSAGSDLLCHRFDVLRALVAYAGLTLPEAQGIRVSDVDLSSGTLRYADRSGTKKSIQIRDDLYSIIRSWLDMSINYNGKPLNDTRAAEIRRRAKAGEKTSDLAKEFKLRYNSTRLIVKGWAWPDSQEPLSTPVRISDQEMLLPRLKPGEKGTWMRRVQRDEERGRLAGAGRAVGIANLTLRCLKRFHILEIVGETACPASGRTWATFFVLGAPEDPFVLGGVKLGKPFKPDEYKIAKAIYQSGEGGLSRPNLEYIDSGARRKLRQMRDSYPELGPYILFPGKRNGGNYRFGFPARDTKGDPFIDAELTH